MKKIPVISVIVPVYQCEQYVKQCVESILAQTYQDFELILVDDGSTDSSGKICDTYQKCDERILVFHQENKGQASARNLALEHARGKWVSFVDSDDIAHPQMLEILLDLAQATSSLMSICCLLEKEAITNEYKKLYTISYQKCKVTESLLYEMVNNGKHHYWVACGKLISADIVKKNPFENGRVFEDNAIVFKWLLEAKNIACISEYMYFYRYNIHGTTKSQFDLKRLDYLWALEEQIKHYKKIKYYKMQKEICLRYYDASLQMYGRVKNELQDNKKAKKILINLWKMIFKNKNCLKLSDYFINDLIGVTFPWARNIYKKIAWRS